LPSTQLDGKLLVVPAGSLDSTVSRQPDAHLFVASKAAWDEALDSIPHLDGLPTEGGQ
jgi:hypothetical protein